MHIFDTGKLCYPYYTADDDKLMEEVIENTRKEIASDPIYTFEKGIKMMNEVYKNENLFKNFDPNFSFWKPYKEDLIFGKKPFRDEEKGGQMRIMTRIIDRQKIDVLPQIFEYKNEEIAAGIFIQKIHTDKRFVKKGKLDSYGINEISKYLLKISPQKYSFINRGEENFIESSKFIRVVNQSYSFQFGLQDLDFII